MFGHHADLCLLGESAHHSSGHCERGTGPGVGTQADDESVEDEIPVASQERVANQGEGGQKSP